MNRATEDCRQHDRTIPAWRAAGLKEWGGDVARVERVRLLGSDGEERMQLLAGEPFAIAADGDTNVF